MSQYQSQRNHQSSILQSTIRVRATPLFGYDEPHPATGRFGAQSTQFRAISTARALNCDSVEHGSRTVSGSEAQRPDAAQEPGLHVRGDGLDRHRRRRQRGDVQHGRRPRASAAPGATVRRHHQGLRGAFGTGTSRPGDVVPRLHRCARRGSQLLCARRISARRRRVLDCTNRAGATQGGCRRQREPARGRGHDSRAGPMVPRGREPGGRKKSGRRSGGRDVERTVRRRP